jgi:hypothetical protein
VLCLRPRDFFPAGFLQKKCSPIKILMIVSRVTRLGKFSPFGRLFTLHFSEETKDVAHNFWIFFSAEIIIINFGQECVGLHFDDFSQTYLVTLIVSDTMKMSSEQNTRHLTYLRTLMYTYLPAYATMYETL